MNFADISLIDLAGMTLGFFLTLMVLSYIIGDNALFRTAIYLFIGVAAGYAAVVAWYNVIWPQLVAPAVFGTSSDRMLVIFPLVLGALMLFKISPRFSALGNPSMAFLLGAGMAAAIGGSILGTVLPQSLATMNLFDPDSLPAGGDFVVRLLSGGFILVGTVTTLAYFHFGIRPSPNQPPARPLWLKVVAWVGQVFIAITFGAIFAGVYAAALTALIERIQFLKDFIFALGAS